jgi:Tfp pilus assembly protein PilV
MKFAPVSNNRRRAGYTLAETLAALLFLAIVIPAVVEALHVASRAGTASIRRAVAARIAERMLTEATLYTNSSATQSGTQVEGTVDYRWTVTRENWVQSSLPLLTAEVRFLTQGQESSVRFSTLGHPVDAIPGSSSSSSSSSSSTATR